MAIMPIPPASHRVCRLGLLILLGRVGHLISHVVSAFARKPVFGSIGMVYAMACIGVLGLIVWAHHLT